MQGDDVDYGHATLRATGEFVLIRYLGTRDSYMTYEVRRTPEAPVLYPLLSEQALAFHGCTERDHPAFRCPGPRSAKDREELAK